MEPAERCCVVVVAVVPMHLTTAKGKVSRAARVYSTRVHARVRVHLIRGMRERKPIASSLPVFFSLLFAPLSLSLSCPPRVPSPSLPRREVRDAGPLRSSRLSLLPSTYRHVLRLFVTPRGPEKLLARFEPRRRGRGTPSSLPVPRAAAAAAFLSRHARESAPEECSLYWFGDRDTLSPLATSPIWHRLRRGSGVSLGRSMDDCEELLRLG